MIFARCCTMNAPLMLLALDAGVTDLAAVMDAAWSSPAGRLRPCSDAQQPAMPAQAYPRLPLSAQSALGAATRIRAASAAVSGSTESCGAAEDRPASPVTSVPSERTEPLSEVAAAVTVTPLLSLMEAAAEGRADCTETEPSQQTPTERSKAEAAQHLSAETDARSDSAQDVCSASTEALTANSAQADRHAGSGQPVAGEDDAEIARCDSAGSPSHALPVSAAAHCHTCKQREGQLHYVTCTDLCIA